MGCQNVTSLSFVFELTEFMCNLCVSHACFNEYIIEISYFYAVMLILVLKDSLRIKFKSLSLQV